MHDHSGEPAIASPSVSPAAPENRPARSTAWRYYVCGLLLLATTINYLDRQALSNTGFIIKAELGLSNEQYGDLEFFFGVAFATGALLFGWLADRTNVRWLYPAVLLLWSAMGYCTGMVSTFAGLLTCRTLLGLFEAGHWPCALKTTQRFLTRRERTLGNSILQSGSSVGAIITPLLAWYLVTDEPGSWTKLFKIVGLIGAGWIFFWLAAFRKSDFEGPPVEPIVESSDLSADRPHKPFWSVIFTGRFVALLVMVFAVNTCWHVFRVWMPLFLVEGRGYSKESNFAFNSTFYIATDIGCIAAGIATVWLTKHRWSVNGARLLVYTCCALCTAASVAIYWLPAGWALTAVLLTVAAGSLGLFPCYYSFSQELSIEHQGKISGLLGSFAWVTVAVLHKYNGRFIDTALELDPAHAYDLGMMLSGLCPILGTLAMLLLWGLGGEAARADSH